eukprot:TRINITY_DN7737_c0_g1_i5.p1 TRINITY_DN7737_c0_g1~~TRINITY_DN7737_c0_g1_i5.p1  ORF type:complete len:1327 (+),score=315.70 TRINITY_DN7737_c0_g1_i5:168-4148(+)
MQVSAWRQDESSHSSAQGGPPPMRGRPSLDSNASVPHWRDVAQYLGVVDMMHTQSNMSVAEVAALACRDAGRRVIAGTPTFDQPARNFRMADVVQRAQTVYEAVGQLEAGLQGAARASEVDIPCTPPAISTFSSLPTPTHTEEPKLCNLDLWLAARDGKVERVRHALQDGADVTWVNKSNESTCKMMYKSRQLFCNSLHAAANFQQTSSEDDVFLGESPRFGRFNACEVVRLLLEAKAPVSRRATIGDDRELEAVHLAAGSGNIETLVLLLESKADPNAEAKKNGQKHYHPIHDAAWFGQTEAVRRLLEFKAKVEATNDLGQTALHLAAEHGHVGIVELIVRSFQKKKGKYGKSAVQQEGKALVKTRDVRGKLPIDLAVEGGQFPPGSLHLFTSCLDHAAQVEAFVKIALSCPAAASALIRNGNLTADDLDGDSSSRPSLDGKAPICKQWRRSLQIGAAEGDPPAIDVPILASLIEHAPQAAVDLLDGLTDAPHVADREHNPLPIRAAIPLGSEACRLSCVYEDSCIWDFNPCAGTAVIQPAWRAELAPTHKLDGLEVQVRVVKLKGLADLRLLHSLANVPDHRIFTKLVVHALLKFVWSRFCAMFLLELVHKALTLAVICYWIWQAWLYPPEDLLYKRLLWSVVASHGMYECVTIVWTSWTCLIGLGIEKFLYHLSREWHRVLISAFTLALASSCHPNFGPKIHAVDEMVNDIDDNQILLAVACILHWGWLLYELRAFQWTGHRLLPIMKSVQPIAGMLVIMLFLTLAFVHAFWAINRAEAAEGPKGASPFWYEVILLLFAGEGFIEKDDLGEMSYRKRVFLLSLTVVALFLFLACALNVFIAVLGDCYDQEQERTICSYLQERASICAGLGLRPTWSMTVGQAGRQVFVHRQMSASTMVAELTRRPSTSTTTVEPTGAEPAHTRRSQCCSKRCLPSQRTLAAVGLFLAPTVVFGALLNATHQSGSSGWLSASFLAASLLFIQGTLRAALMEGWRDKFLWLCHEVDVDEGMFLAPDERDLVEHYGRIARIKRYVYEQCRLVSMQCKTMCWSVHQLRENFSEQMGRQTVILMERMERHKEDLRTIVAEEASKRSPSPASVPLPLGFNGGQPPPPPAPGSLELPAASSEEFLHAGMSEDAASMMAMSPWHGSGLRRRVEPAPSSGDLFGAASLPHIADSSGHSKDQAAALAVMSAASASWANAMASRVDSLGSSLLTELSEVKLGMRDITGQLERQRQAQQRLDERCCRMEGQLQELLLLQRAEQAERRQRAPAVYMEAAANTAAAPAGEIYTRVAGAIPQGLKAAQLLSKPAGSRGHAAGQPVELT